MVGVRVISVSNDQIEIDPRQARLNAVRTVLETLIVDDGTDAERTKIAAVLADLLQLDIEVRVHIDDLPVDEETLQWSGPGQGDRNEMLSRYGERMRWDHQGPNRWLVSTEDFITVTWDATAASYRVGIRVARKALP